MFLIRQNNFGVEIIKYHTGNPFCDDCAGTSDVKHTLSAAEKQERQANINLFRSLNVTSEGRDYIEASRSRSYFKILEYGTCNHWTHFVTFSLDKDKADRYKGQDALKVITGYFAYFKQYVFPEFKYLLVPELHKDGAVHFHGLVYAPDNVVPMKYVRVDYKTRKPLYRNMWFFERLGSNCFIKIDNETPYITYYLTKYIQKALGDNICAHRYYVSQGLKGYRVFKNDLDISFDLSRFIQANSLRPSFSNDFIQKFEISGLTIENVLEDCIMLSVEQLEAYNARRLYHKMKDHIVFLEQQEVVQEKRLAEGLPLFTDQDNRPLWITIRRKAAELASADSVSDPPEFDEFEFVQDDFFDDVAEIPCQNSSPSRKNGLPF